MAEEAITFPQRSAAPVGRSLPHSIEAEEYLLSCCLLDGAEVISRCLEARIRPESFYVPAHGIIFEKLLELYNRQAPVDVSVVAEELKTAKQLDAVGGYAFLTHPKPQAVITAPINHEQANRHRVPCVRHGLGIPCCDCPGTRGNGPRTCLSAR